MNPFQDEFLDTELESKLEELSNMRASLKDFFQGLKKQNEDYFLDRLEEVKRSNLQLNLAELQCWKVTPQVEILPPILTRSANFPEKLLQKTPPPISHEPTHQMYSPKKGLKEKLSLARPKSLIPTRTQIESDNSG